MKMTVLIVVNNLDSGGTEHYLLRLLPLLKKELSYSIYVYAITQPGKLASKFEQEGIKVISPDFKAKNKLGQYGLHLYSFWFLIKMIRQINPDVVHSFLTKSYFMTALANIFCRKPFVMSRRCLNEYQKRRPILGKIERFLHRSIDRAVGNSNAVVAQLCQEGIPKEKVKLIYNGITTKWYAKKVNLNRDSKECRMIVVANLHAYKGHKDLLDALSYIKLDLPRKWSLFCVGRDEGMLGVLKERASFLGLDKHVFWLGEQEEPQVFFEQADMAISCSLEEGFSNSILEAMAMGLPVVATNVGGNSEIVVDRETGFLVSKESPRSLAEAILVLALDSVLRKQMGEAGEFRVRQYFDMSTSLVKYRELYEDVVKACAV